MSDDPRWDPEMRAARQAMDAAAAKFPPVEVVEPLDPQRAVNDRLAMAAARGGPAMATTSEFWIYANGRRVFCRLHRPRASGVLPVLVWFHGGGWVWLTVDTHDRLVRELATAGGVATVSVDYTLSPEAKFPQALAECVGVVRGLAARATEWGLDASRIVLGGDSAGGNLAIELLIAGKAAAVIGEDVDHLHNEVGIGPRRRDPEVDIDRPRHPEVVTKCGCGIREHVGAFLREPLIRERELQRPPL